MNKLKKCFGIISGFPDKGDSDKRERRIDRFNQLLNQLNDLWPDVDILIIAQNWQNYKLPEIKNKIIDIRYDKLIGILNARWELRKEFLKRDYDYIIMLDDDDIIKCTNDHVHLDYMNELDNHPQGFAIIKPLKIYDKGTWVEDYPYKRAPLNLCAVSRFIYEKENIPDVDLQKSQALEDDTYAYLLHIKYGKYEFDAPKGIEHIQYKNDQYRMQYVLPDKYLPSTWNNENINMFRLVSNTRQLIEYIKLKGDLPNMKEWHRLDEQKAANDVYPIMRF